MNWKAICNLSCCFRLSKPISLQYGPHRGATLGPQQRLCHSLDLLPQNGYEPSGSRPGSSAGTP